MWAFASFKYLSVIVMLACPTTFKVTVEAGERTTHTVTVSPAYREKLTGDKVPTEKLVEKAFEFFLDQ
jgi:hypothetical protein